MCVCVCVCVSIYIYVCIHIYIYTYIYEYMYIQMIGKAGSPRHRCAEGEPSPGANAQSEEHSSAPSSAATGVPRQYSQQRADRWALQHTLTRGTPGVVEYSRGSRVLQG